MNRESIEKDILTARSLIGKLSVSGDAIDVAAAARAALAHALNELKDADKVPEENAK